MKKLDYIRTIALFMAVLVISLPIVLAEEYSLLYDANGNLIYDQETNVYREYNELNQLIRTRQNNATGIILQEYTFDPIKERVFIKDEFYSNGSLKSSTYYFDDDYIIKQNSSGTYNQTYIYQDGVLVGYEDVDGRKRYVLPDHEGSVQIVLNESGDIIEENLFSPFAEPLAGVKESRFSYEVKEYDSLVKDYDFHFRRYLPHIRIYGQPDTLIQNVYDAQSLNRYAFEKSNPYRYIDINGRDPTGILVILGVLALISFLPTIKKLAEGNYKKEEVTKDVISTAGDQIISHATSPYGISLDLINVILFFQDQEKYLNEGGFSLTGDILEKIKKEFSKEVPDEDLKCKIINCDLKYEVTSDDREGQSDSPSTSNPSSQADSSRAISQSAQQNINQASGGYVSGIGYVTSGGSVYPTSNPYFSPGTGNAPWGGSYSNVVQDPSTGKWVIAS